MELKTFLVQGSAPEPYKVTFRKNGTNLSAYCTCPAGENGQHCKHRLGILSGSTKSIVSKNTSDVEVVCDWLPGSDIEEAWLEHTRLESELIKVKRNLSEAKKALARAMRD